MKTYGLIGFPLSHSFSVGYFSNKFLSEGIAYCHYKNFPLTSIEELPILLQREQLSGLNVTIPYKEAVINYLNFIDPTAQAIGAVNCIRIADEKLTGYNTDVFGFELSLKKLIGEARPKALILGTGGSSKAVAYCLSKLEMPFQFVSRDKKDNCLTYEELSEDIIHHNPLIINTTPLGMYPTIQASPAIPYRFITPANYMFDLIYNPAETAFLKHGALRGAKTQNGLEMLQLQAEKSWEIWNTE